MREYRITSTANAHLKDLIRLRSQASSSLFFADGPHLIETALRAGVTIRESFLTDSFASSTEGERLLRLLTEKSGKVYAVSDPVMKRLSGTETPQGIVATVSVPSLGLKDLPVMTPPLLVVIDGVQDPGNLGTIIRTADAAGADGVIILPGTCEPFMPKTIRATAGSIFHLPVVRAAADELLRWHKMKGITLAVTVAGGKHSVYDALLTGPLAMVFGNEARGVSALLKGAAGISMSIPILGRAESLNVATAAAVCLYEAVRQRRATPPP